MKVVFAVLKYELVSKRDGLKMILQANNLEINERLNINEWPNMNE